MKVIIIGASFAGVSCALELRRLDASMEIAIIEQKSSLGYFSGGLVQTLRGTYKELRNVNWLGEDTLSKQTITLYLGEQVLKINGASQSVETNRQILHYDYLVLASGARVADDRVSEEREENYFTVGQFKEDQQLLKKIEHSHLITILGANTTGIELADSLCRLGKKVQLIEQYSYPLFKYFDESFLVPFLEQMKKQPRLDLHFNQHAQLKRTENYVEVSLGKQELMTELVIFSGSLQPNHGYLRNAVSLHSDRTIRVNEQLQTSVPTIYAIGNLIQQKFPLTNDWFFMPSMENAIRTGKAVARILTKHQKKYEGSLRPMTIQAFGFYLGSVGLLESEAFLYNGTVQTDTRHYQLATGDITIKYVYDVQTSRLLGVQMRNQHEELKTVIAFFEKVIFQKMSITEILSDEIIMQWQTILRKNHPRKGREWDEA